MTSKTTSLILWPRPSLAGCIFCAIVRDTRGVALDPADRFNFFPASPLCSVTGIIAGDLHQITHPDQMEQPWAAEKLPRISFSGAQLGPLVSWSSGEIYVITVAFYPDAFSAMTGLDLSSFTGCMASAEDVVPELLLNPCEDFFEGSQYEGAEKCFSRLGGEIEAVWSNARRDRGEAAQWLNDWTRNLVARAALSGPGKSARQIARRIKTWTGVNERDLKGLAQSEQLYSNIHKAMQKGDMDWAGLAAVSGFADQPHMIRRMRQHTGFTPEQLRKMAPSEEALWGYRLLGAYFSRPGN